MTGGHPIVRFALVGHVDVAGARLTSAEQERANALRDPADRAAFVDAHRLARQVVAELLELDPAELRLHQVCATCGGPHGRPTVEDHPGVWVTLSHTRGAVAAIAAHVPCGVDVEPVENRPVPASALTPAERERLVMARDPVQAGIDLWVAKEAAVKAGLAELEKLGAFAAPELGPCLLTGAVATSKAAAGRWSHDGLRGAWLVCDQSVPTPW